MQPLNAVILPFAFLGCGFSLSSMADEGDAWQYEVTPYFLAAGLNGTVGVRGVKADLDMSFSDIWDDFKSGLMGLFTARRGPWMYGLEGVYFKLQDEGSKTVTGPFGNVSVNGALQVTTSMYIYQGTVGYRFLDEKTKLDLIGALRYTRLVSAMDVKIATVPGIVFPGGATSASGHENWTDAVVGLAVQQPIADNWWLTGYVDAGAGGSDFTYQLIAGVNWMYAKDFVAKAGYRLLDWDYENNGTVWDMTAAGPYIGLGIRF